MTTTPQQSSTAIVRVNPDAVPIALATFGTLERLSVIKEQIGRGWKEPMTDAELDAIGLICQRSRLDPLAKPAQIYFIKRYDSALKKYVMTAQTSIDGARLTAARTREYLGQVGPEWTADGETWKTVWLSADPPAAARVGVVRKGFKEPIWSTAVWSRAAQYVDQWQGDRISGKKLAPFWEKMGAEMLAKTAEFNALKRAFPEETNELELASAEQERQAQAASNARRYDEIYGKEDEGRAFADLPQPALNAAGDTVDTDSGEVLVERPEAEPERPVDHWARNRELVAKATDLGVQGIPTLNARSSKSAVEMANDELEDRIRALESDLVAQPAQASAF